MRRRNRGAYTSPFSGVGMEFFPGGIKPDHSGVVLHEAGYLPDLTDWNFPNVLSPFWRLYYCFTPGNRVLFGQRAFPLTPREMMLIPDHQLFHSQGRGPVRAFWLSFHVARRLDMRQTIPILLAPGQTEMALMRQVVRLFGDRRGLAHRSRIFHLSLALLHLVLSRSELHWQDVPSPVVARITQHMEEHLAQPLAVADLAELANLCPESLTRLFNRHQGQTPARFLTHLRVRKAAGLLVNTDDTIDDIAQQTGFPNRAYFSRVFKKITKESPARFRKAASWSEPLHPAGAGPR